MIINKNLSGAKKKIKIYSGGKEKSKSVRSNYARKINL